MKSIDEGFEDHKSENQTLFRTSKVSFKAGIEFAERWIPVEEELPEYDTAIIVKFTNMYGEVCNSIALLELHSQYDSKESPKLKQWFAYPGWGHEFKTVTHWRPINHV